MFAVGYIQSFPFIGVTRTVMCVGKVYGDRQWYDDVANHANYFFTLLLKTCFYFTLLTYDEINFIDIFRILSSFSREIQKVCYVVYVYI